MRRGRPPTLEHASEHVDTPDHRDLEDDALRRIALSSAVGRLEERDRELIALRYGADLTARQIAELQGAKTNAIESRSTGPSGGSGRRWKAGPHPCKEIAGRTVVLVQGRNQRWEDF